MKKTTLIILLYFIGFTATFSQEINPATAGKVAVSFIASQHQSEHSLSGDVYHLYSSEGILCYLFNLLPCGYIAVSGDKQMIPVMAYSFSAAQQTVFSENDPLIALLKNDLNAQKKNILSIPYHIREHNSDLWDKLLQPEFNSTLQKDSLFQQWPPDGTTCSGGWITTYWNQTFPYYNMCPMDLNTGNRSYAGCPAIAMAQIVNYHQTLNTTRFSDSDDYYHNFGSGNKYWIDDDYLARGFPSFPELNLYLDTLEYKYYDKAGLSDNDKAALSFACGIAAKQVFSSAGSGTFEVEQAYDAYLRFGFNTSVLMLNGDSGIYQAVINNIIDALPVHLAVVDSAWSSGHNLVIDGYNTNDYYHLNFGWGGSSDGWYYLFSGLPYQLNVIEGVVTYINKQSLNAHNEATKGGNDFTIIPNPATDIISILTQKEFKPVICNIYDVNGRLLLSAEPFEFKYNSFSVNISPLKQGIYFIGLNDGINIINGKLIKL